MHTQSTCSVQEAADALGVTVVTVRNWIHRGFLPAARCGPKNWRVSAAAVAELLEPLEAL